MMHKPTMFLPAVALGLAGAVSIMTSAFAFPITYTEQATASGSLGGQSFTDALVTLTMINDTDNVVNNSPGLFENLGTVTVSVSAVNGGLPVTFTDSMEVFMDQTLSPPTVGFTDLTFMPNPLDVLDDGSVFFASYDLKTLIGPVSGNPALSSLNVSFPTTGGALILTDIPDNTSTFTATVAVPAPPIGRGLSVIVAFGGLLFGAKLLERSAKRPSPSDASPLSPT